MGMSGALARYLFAGQAAMELVFAWGCVRLLPFRWVVRYLGQPGAMAAPLQPDMLPAAGRIAWAVQAVARRGPVTFTCLMQAVAAQRMLRRRNIPATVYLAMLAGRQGSGNPLLAHAWVRCGDRVVTGQCDESQYRVIATFA